MKIEDIILYICKKYPIPDDLSKARLTKLVYLVDWEACLRLGKQLTGIKWYFHNFGPYVDDVVEAARQSKNLVIKETENFYGETKELISGKTDVPWPSLDRTNAEIIDSVIEETKKMYWNDFIRHVYNTPPISGSTRYTALNLLDFAKEIRRTNKSINLPR